MGPAGNPGQGFVYRGGWTAATAYAAYDVVTNAGQSYVATAPFTSGSNFDTTHFQLMAATGDTGPAGSGGGSTGQGFVFRGAWTAATAYAANDVVTDAGSTAVPNGYTINGNFAGGGGSEGSPIQELLVRQGDVYVKVSGGQWQHFNPQSGSLYNNSLPDAFATDATGATTSTVAVSSVTAPADPIPAAIAPGSSGKTLQVGTGQAYPTISAAFAAAAAGHTIHIAAEIFKETPPATTVPLALKANLGALLDCTGLTTLARGKGGIVPAADMTIENLAVTGAGMTETSAGGTAGVRPDAGCGYLTLINCHLYENQNGCAHGDVPVVVVFDGGKLENNGLPPGNAGNGYTHNYYGSHGSIRAVTKNGFVSTKPNGGHAFKFRGNELELSNSQFDAMDAAVIDVADGSTICTLDNVVLTKAAGANNHSIIDYATDDTSAGNSGMSITNSTIDALCDNPFFLIGGGSQITLDAATKAKTTGAIVANGGGKIVGL